MFLTYILGCFEAFKLQKSCSFSRLHPQTPLKFYSHTTIVMLFPTWPPCRSGLEPPLHVLWKSSRLTCMAAACEIFLYMTVYLHCLSLVSSLTVATLHAILLIIGSFLSRFWSSLLGVMLHAASVGEILQFSFSILCSI